MGLLVEEVLEVLGQSLEGELLDLCCNSFQKKMLPNTQSIEGL